ncbi:MAG: Crp/Fnr family transcriptional regulator [Leptolyngbya sp. Prado105]|jgi:CRP-like cAMP-binding protein|nr:Crp/Fnr family transcriptional regulator [Leptolyngbya sp. Prado105]
MSQTYPRNHLLNALPPDEYDRLSQDLEFVTMSLGQVLYEPNQAIEYAYFPITAVISHFNLMESGQSVETSSIGNEGMVGLSLVLGTDRISMRATVQISGSALRISADSLQLKLQQIPTLQSLLLRYVQTFMSQIAQDLTCTQLHSSQARCCYLLLLLHDRVGDPILPLTQSLLAQMIGIRRDRVSEIIAALAQAELIEHQRGRIKILKRSGLRNAACECYQIWRSRFDQKRP